MARLALIGGLVTAAVTLPANVLGQVAQRAEDEYTRYELLDPSRQQFRIRYDVTATTPGARVFFNPIRKGSDATDEAVFDLASGAPLDFVVVSGTAARDEGLLTADPDTRYIRVVLAHAVPTDGEARIRIDKTYRDAQSYFIRGDTLIFSRSLGIKRNAVVLPPGYELIGVNIPSQVLREPDGRLVISFINAGPDPAPLVVPGQEAAAMSRALVGVLGAALGALLPSPAVTQPPATGAAALAARLTERAAQTREIVYFLRQPEAHAFDLYHDYTETRDGVGQYLNVVRAGSTVADPSAVLLDTGEPLSTRILKGDAISRAAIDIGEPVRAETEVVVITFPPVKRGQSTRLRITETYTDPARYRVEGDELIWDRSFGRPANAVVLPEGWYLTHSAAPATVSLTEDGRVRLDFVNPRNDELGVLIVARRR